tara:strand:+ start:185 stop:607 length:423 start_codon:yes stop_codon:yes gene_type:complete
MATNVQTRNNNFCLWFYIRSNNIMSNIEHTTYILDPDRTFQELETASEEKAKALRDFRRLEYHLPILKAKMKQSFIRSGDKSTDASDKAILSAEYIKHIDALVLAESIYSRKKDSYDNKRALKDMRITQESSARQMIKGT